jgi:hypothetical protein
MLRDSDTKGKKLLFDSMTTQRDASLKKDWTFHDYDQITDGVGYKVPEVRHIPRLPLKKEGNFWA